MTKEVGEEVKDAMMEGQEGKETFHVCCPHSEVTTGKRLREEEAQGTDSSLFTTTESTVFVSKAISRPRESRTSSPDKKDSDNCYQVFVCFVCKVIIVLRLTSLDDNNRRSGSGTCIPRKQNW